jgi:predicted TIM-barrel fold metal-dependent hydrolase
MQTIPYIVAAAAMCAFAAIVTIDSAHAHEASRPTPEAARFPAGIIPFVDAHVHLNDEAMQLDLMDRFGATQAIVFWGRRSDNDLISDAALRRPDRFIPFVSISPERRTFRTSWDAQNPALLQELDRLLASGRFKGIGEISAVHFPSPGLPEADYDPASPMMRGILDLARKHKVPVMVHIEITRINELAVLLAAFPDVPVIWAHGGYTPLFLAQRMLERYPNLYYELSARVWPRHPRAPDYTILHDGVFVWPEWLRLIEDNPTRFIIGTDASHHAIEREEMKHRSVQSFLRQLNTATRARVARDNILSLVEPLR